MFTRSQSRISQMLTIQIPLAGKPEDLEDPFIFRDEPNELYSPPISPWIQRGSSEERSPPDDDEIAALVRRTIADFGRSQLVTPPTEQEERRLVAELRGVPLADAARLIHRSLLEDGRIGDDDLGGP